MTTNKWKWGTCPNCSADMSYHSATDDRTPWKCKKCGTLITGVVLAGKSSICPACNKESKAKTVVGTLKWKNQYPWYCLAGGHWFGKAGIAIGPGIFPETSKPKTYRSVAANLTKPKFVHEYISTQTAAEQLKKTPTGKWKKPKATILTGGIVKFAC